MRGKKRIEIGSRFGRLVVVSLARVHQRTSGVRVNVWRCACDCGETTDVFCGNLTNKVTQSCGCLQRELASERLSTHGLTRSDEWNAWDSMIARCYRKTHRYYGHYGGRGITVCDEWKSDFLSFLRDMGARPSSKHSIDRIDNNGNYEPGNCRWATSRQQGNNKRTCVYLTIGGKTRTIAEWSRVSGVKSSTISHRVRIGWSTERSVFQQPISRRNATCSC